MKLSSPQPHALIQSSMLILCCLILTENILPQTCTPGYWERIPGLTASNWWGICSLFPAILRWAKGSPRSFSSAISWGSQIKYSWLQEETKTIKLHTVGNRLLEYFREHFVAQLSVVQWGWMILLHWKSAFCGPYPDVSQNNRAEHCTDGITPYWRDGLFLSLSWKTLRCVKMQLRLLPFHSPTYLSN